MKKKKEHNQGMLEIASALSYTEFDDIKLCDTTFKMWDSLSTIYGEDKNVQRSKSESLRGNFDNMWMDEGEHIAQYASRIKEVVSAIRSIAILLDDEIVLSKVLRTFLPIYAIRVSSIQELRCIPEIKLSLEGIVGRITTFSYLNLITTDLRTLNLLSRPSYC